MMKKQTNDFLIFQIGLKLRIQINEITIIIYK